jgi:hypothetical protein
MHHELLDKITKSSGKYHFNTLDLSMNSSIHPGMDFDRHCENSAERGLFNLALIAAEDAAAIASLSPEEDCEIDDGISRLRELGYRIAILAEAIEALRSPMR